MIRRMLPLAMAFGITSPGVELFAFIAAPPVVAQSSVLLKLRRLGDRVDVVVDGISADAQVVSQSSSPTQWSGQLRAAAPLSLRRSQEVALEEAGLQSIRLSAKEQGVFELVVKASKGMALPEPQIQVDGSSLIVSFTRLPIQTRALTSGRLDLERPGRVEQPHFVPPVQSRATAPPLGDIAVGTMLVNPSSLVNVSGPPVSLVLNGAPAKDALMSLARIGGFSFVYVNSPQEASGGDQSVELVSMAFKEESYGRALNSVVLASGLQAKLDGRTLLVGKSLHGSSYIPQVSKVFRLNQVSTETAANYLSSLGAQMSRVRQVEVTRGQAASAETSELSSEVSQTKQFLSEVETLSAQQGPLLGLVGTTDGRLNTVTVVGESRLIALAESYLKQIDLRRRQVAVKVQVIDVALDNDKAINSSFSSRIGNTFIVSESGKGHLNFGDYKPGNSLGSGVYGSGASGVPGTYMNYGQVSDGSTQYRQSDDSFYSYLEAQIESRSAKILAEPTLLVGEGQTSAVKTGLEVVVNVGDDDGKFEKETAGITLTIGVDRIDDNGFVTMNIVPKLGFPVLAGSVGNVEFYNIDSRELVASGIRLRDRQTLVVSGVMSEQQEEIATKWPILGDLPLVGSLFRGSKSGRKKQELVVVVTPQIIDDQQGGAFGYGYQPRTAEINQVLRSIP